MRKKFIFYRLISFSILAMLILAISGCASMHKSNKLGFGAAGVASLPPYSGPKAKIMIADFEIRAAKATQEVGVGMRELLINTLSNSNRFSIVERQAPGTVLLKKETTAQESTQAQTEEVKVKPADLVIAATVTDFEPQTSGGKAGIGGGGGVGSGILGGLLGASLNKAYVTLDLRIVDTSTSEVLATTRVQGSASDVRGSFMAAVGNGALGVSLSAYANTPMEKAIRICIIEAIRYISQAIPDNYYKY